MEKIDAYETLTTWVAAFTGENIARETPFLFIMQRPDGKGCKLINCATSHNIKDLVQVILIKFVASMKEAVKDGADPRETVGEILAEMCKIAMIENFFMEMLFERFDEDSKEAFEESA